jgi:hypothetical protein
MACSLLISNFQPHDPAVFSRFAIFFCAFASHGNSAISNFRLRSAPVVLGLGRGSIVPPSWAVRAIPIFFADIDTLHQVTLTLDAHPDRFGCRRCGQRRHWVSHGFVRKKQLGGDPVAVGKRLFCANRRGRDGCGATLRLSVAECLPRLLLISNFQPHDPAVFSRFAIFFCAFASHGNSAISNFRLRSAPVVLGLGRGSIVPPSWAVRAIPIFFADIDTLHQVTLTLDAHPDRFGCRRCGQRRHWVSHGFVRKKQLGGDPVAVGKRLFCANRRGRDGCGATLRLSVAECLPRLHYGAVVLQGFVLALLGGSATAAAYLQATGAQSSRHGWRWLMRFSMSLSRWRVRLPGPDALDAPAFAAGCPRRRLLLPTLAALRTVLGEDFVACFQCAQQAAFLV